MKASQNGRQGFSAKETAAYGAGRRVYSEEQELHDCAREPRTGPRVMHGWEKKAFTDEPELA